MCGRKLTGEGTLEKVMKMRDDDLSDYVDVTIFSLQTVRAKMAECSKLPHSLQQKAYIVSNTEHALIELKTIQQKRTICKGRTFCFLLLSHSPSLSSKGHRFPSFHLFCRSLPFFSLFLCSRECRSKAKAAMQSHVDTAWPC